MDKSSQNTLDLLAQYDNHTSERDKTIEHIERRVVSEDTRPTYDDLFKENVRLKLQLKEQETEIESLKCLVEGMRTAKDDSNTITILEQPERTTPFEITKKEPILPPRSADRQKNSKNLSIPIPGPELGRSDDREQTTIESVEIPKLSPQKTVSKSGSPQNIKSPFKPKLNLNGPEIDVSPATSVTYKTSRITIASPNSPNRSITSNRLKSPQGAHRVTAFINNQVHSPLKGVFGSETFSSTTRDDTLTLNSSPLDNDTNMKSPITHIQALRSAEHAVEFSPSSKENLNNFADFLEDTFAKGDMVVSAPVTTEPSAIESPPDSVPLPPPPPAFPAIARERNLPHSMKLGSPVILNRKESEPAKSSETRKSSFNSTTNRTQLIDAGNGRISQKPSVESLQSKTGISSIPALNTSASQNPNLNITKPQVGSVLMKSSIQKSDIPLFVQPEDFGTIRMVVLSTLYHETEAPIDEPQVLFSVIDRNSEKEMFKFSKTIQKIYELDGFLKSKVPSLSLPSLPDRQLLESLVPSKVDGRREILSQYFYSIFTVPEYPSHAALRIAEFMSTDTVMNPVLLGDTVKEGALLMRKPKALGGASNWRARYGVLGGDILTLFDRGQPMEKIRLKQSSIELLPNLPEERHGTKNGFVINEHKKSGLSSTTRYFLCAETSKEREVWVSAINEFFVSASIPPSSSNGSISTNGESHTSHSKNDNNSSQDQIYVTDLTLSSSNQSPSDLPNTTPREVEFGGDYEESKESKRLKMRSFFPFKKITSNALNLMYDDTETINSQESEPKFSDNSVTKSLENMNLSYERQQPKVFGSSLQDCLLLSSHKYQGKHELPSVVYRCLEFLYKNHGIQEEGLFRLSGSSAMIKSLQEQFDAEYDVDLSNYNKRVSESNVSPNGTYSSNGAFIDVNTVSGLLKLYLRRLPHLIFGEESYSSFKYITDEYHNDAAMIAYKFRDLVRSGSIPQANVSLMYCLFELLVKIQENQRYNKMNVKNLCIVFSPTLNVPVTILQPLIIDFSCIFQDGDPVEQDKRQELDIHLPQI